MECVNDPYKVAIVVDRSFGERLADLPINQPVWVVDSAVNAPEAERLIMLRSPPNHLTGITIFRPGTDSLPEGDLLIEFSTIDLHHGPYSAKPPYTVIEVFGTLPTAEIKSMLAEYGFSDFQPTADGFVAKREPPALTVW
jgi:hypothetical protein